MPSETIEPPMGTPDPDASRPGDAPASDPKGPGNPGGGTSSNDELSVLLSQEAAKPDPMLGSYASDDAHAGPAPEPSGPVAEPGDAARGSESFDAFGAINAFTDAVPVEPFVDPVPPLGIETRPDAARPRRGAPRGPSDDAPPNLFQPPEDRPAPAPEAGSFEAFSALDLEAPSSAPGKSRARAKARPAPAPEEDEADGDDAPRRMSLPTLLLLSYASALTLFLIYHFRGHRAADRADDELIAAVGTPADPGRRAREARKAVAPPPIAADHLTTLGKPLRVGGLEVTPLDVDSGRVELRRSITIEQKKDGGSNALKLRVRLKNVSPDTIFSPLDEAFLRARDRDTLDSLIENADGQQIEMYPLAVSSEWTIAGQEFRELRPGDSYETLIVSAPDSYRRKAPEMTWRLRLRTGIDQTETIGIRFRPDEIR